MYDVSYQNLIMYNAIIPSYNIRKDGKGKTHDEVINASDPKNKARVHKLMFGD